MKYLVITGTVLFGLAACGPTALPPVNGFGNSTMNNTLAQTGDSTYRVELAQRFASEVPSTINFEFNSYQLDAEARGILQKQATWIRQFPEVRFSVFGNTDLVGSAEYNYQLGLRRAQAAVNFLVSQGVERSRLDALVSFGDTRPLVQTEAPNRTNRRTVTEVSGFVASDPMVMNGKYAEIVFRQYVDSAGTPASDLVPTSLNVAAVAQ